MSWTLSRLPAVMSAMVSPGDPELMQIGLGDGATVLVVDQSAQIAEQPVQSFGGEGAVTRVGPQHGQVVVGGVGDVADVAAADGRGEPGVGVDLVDDRRH